MRAKRLVWKHVGLPHIAWIGELEDSFIPVRFTLEKANATMYRVICEIEGIPSIMCVGVTNAKNQAQWVLECFVKSLLSN